MADNLPPGIDHVTAARNFVSQVQKTGGASMDLNTGRILPPGRKGFMVGGEPDVAGNRIQTSYIPDHSFGEHQVLQNWSDLRSRVGGSFGAHMGAWADQGNVEIDASRKVKRANQAVRMGASRGEKAVWNNSKMSEIDTSSALSKKRVASDLGRNSSFQDAGGFGG